MGVAHQFAGGPFWARLFSGEQQIKPRIAESSRATPAATSGALRSISESEPILQRRHFACFTCRRIAMARLDFEWNKPTPPPCAGDRAANTAPAIGGLLGCGGRGRLRCLDLGEGQAIGSLLRPASTSVRFSTLQCCFR